ncbi:MAG: M48 family metallopeptidase [Bacteroidetes bacterium]|nr:M48 family metallopeptidase [Bacteroidota bacterium]
MTVLQLGNIEVDVVQKDIKNIHLSVYPPTGRVTISAPNRFDIEDIRVYAISRLAWIKKQQSKIKRQEREAPREYINRESHYFLGKRYLMKVIELNAPPQIILKHKTIELHVRPRADLLKKQIVMDKWYRERLKETASELISKWEKIMKVNVDQFGIKRMRTKWGTCNKEANRIWLNLELVKKPIDCIEYIIVHEMLHLQERTHNDRFIALMDYYMSQWRLVKEELNKLPVGMI